MKTKKSDILLCVLFCGFLGVMLALYLLLPVQTFSEKEKRELAKAPVLTWDNIASGEFGEQAESYLADHIPGRDLLVGISSYYDLLSNRQVTKDIYLAKNDRLVEAPVKNDTQKIARNMRKINDFAEMIDMSVDIMIVPSAGYFYTEQIIGLQDPYCDGEIIQNIYQQAGQRVTGVDITGVYEQMQDKDSLYYRTDHHWKSRGAYTAYQAYMQYKNRQYLPQDAFTISTVSGFFGSTYSRSGLWLTTSDMVELWNSGTKFSVQNAESDTVHDGVFYRERLEELDKYTVFLDGNHSLVRIQNQSAAGKGKLLVIRDSYANCLGTFLAEGYEEVVLVDLRYYKEPISELVQQENFADVLVCYSLSNFMTDNNIIFLR